MMEWYEVYGCRFYDINIYTKEIRSHKHFNADPFHKLKPDKYGKVTITDDYGKSKRSKVDDLYIQTFNMGNVLHPSPSGVVNAGGMKAINKKFDIGMNFSKYVERSSNNENEHIILVRPFEFINEKL